MYVRTSSDIYAYNETLGTVNFPSEELNLENHTDAKPPESSVFKTCFWKALAAAAAAALAGNSTMRTAL